MSSGKITHLQNYPFTQFSKESFLAFQIPKRTDVRQREGKSILVLIPHGAQGKSPVFETETAAIPVVRCLCRSILDKAESRVEAQIGSRA